MSTTVFTAEGIDQYGRFTIVKRVLEDDGTTSNVHRQPVTPGNWNNGQWEPTDTATFPPVAKTVAQENWTPAVVDAYKAKFPAPPPPRPDGEIDQESLNNALTAPGSVVRALGLVMFDEINKLRVKNGDPAYTMTQFKNALIAKMR